MILNPYKANGSLTRVLAIPLSATMSHHHYTEFTSTAYRFSCSNGTQGSAKGKGLVIIRLDLLNGKYVELHIEAYYVPGSFSICALPNRPSM